MKSKTTSFRPPNEDKERINQHSLPGVVRYADFKSQLSMQPSEDKCITLTNPNIEMSCYLKEKIAVLERENTLLKNELTMKMSKIIY